MLTPLAFAAGALLGWKARAWREALWNAIDRVFNDLNLHD